MGFKASYNLTKYVLYIFETKGHIDFLSESLHGTDFHKLDVTFWEKTPDLVLF